MKIKKIKAFTLVELIIVITILAILTTIAFVSFQGYLKSARDGNRVSTFNSIKKGLDIFYTKVGNYPQVDEKKSSGELFGMYLTHVGTIGSNVSDLIELKTIPIDPLTGEKYIYGVDYSGNKYQIASILESNDLTYTHPFIAQTYANSNNNFVSKVVGEYDGLIKFSTGGNLYLGNIPSLIHSNIGNVSLIATGTAYVVDKKKNLPYSNLQNQNEIIPSNEIIKQIANNQNAVLTGINISNIDATTLSSSFSGDILDSFGGDLLNISKMVLGNTTPSQPVTPAICNAYEQGTSGVCKDPHWSSVVLLVKGEDFSDTSGKNSLTPSGNTRTDTSRVKFGSSSLYFDGTGDYVSIPDSSHLDFGTAPFTIEAWVNTDVRGGYDRIIAGGNNSDGGNNQWFLGAWPGASVDFGYWGGSSYVESAPSVGVWNNNEWYHVAIVRNGANVYYFWNGVLKSTWNMGAGVSMNTGSYGVTLGARYHNGSLIEFLHGNIDELRITKGVARYTTGFTLQTQSFATE